LTISSRRRGTRAIVAVGRSILIMVWRRLAGPTAPFHPLRSGFNDANVDAERRERNHLRQLQSLCDKVTSSLLTGTIGPACLDELRHAAPGAASCPLAVDFGSVLSRHRPTWPLMVIMELSDRDHQTSELDRTSSLTLVWPLAANHTGVFANSPSLNISRRFGRSSQKSSETWLSCEDAAASRSRGSPKWCRL
jgi:hypothetical protein